MPNNPASRIYRLMLRARAVDSPTQMQQGAGDVWPTVFELGDAGGEARDHEVARLLRLSLEQVDAIEQHLIEVGASQDVYDKHLPRIRNALSLRQLATQWAQLAQNQFDEPTIAMIRAVAVYMPATDPPLTDQQIADARSIVGEFREAVKAADLSPVLVAFLRRQVGFLERALREYPIRGAAAFREASDDAGADWFRNAEMVGEFEDEPVVHQAKHIWGRIQDIAKGVSVIGDAAGKIYLGTLGIAHLLFSLHVVPPKAEAAIRPILGIESGVVASPRLIGPGDISRDVRTTPATPPH